MKLRSKVISIVGIVWVVLFGLVYLAQVTILEPEFIAFEQHADTQPADTQPAAVVVKTSVEKHAGLSPEAEGWIHWDIFFHLATLCAVGFVTSLLFLFLLECFVLRRIVDLTSQIEWIGRKGKFDRQITLKGRDELNVMTNEVNKMLSALQLAHQQEIDRNKKQLDRRLHYDTVTDLPTRFYFTHYCQAFLAKKPTRAFLGVFNLHDFRRINDVFGHAAGDEVLKQIAVRLNALFREPDVVVRYVGDEFYFCLQDWDTEEGMQFAQQLFSVVKQPVFLEGQEIFLSASIGMFALIGKSEVLSDIQHKLALALSKARKTGRNKVVVYDDSLEPSKSKRHVLLVSDFHRALENHELFLEYQPQIRLSDGCMVGVEALVRWRHPREGLISPADFIPLAEETGLIINMDQWVIREVFSLCATWQAHDVTVALNLSALHFKQPNFMKGLKTLLHEYQISPSRIELELTESSVVEDVDVSISVLRQLRELGFKIAIDDFGAGYSSMNYLKNFPLDYMKIDKAFVEGLPEDENNRAIIEAFIALAKSLQLKTIVEGVETKAQLDFLSERKVDLIQGYIFSRPLSREALLALPLDQVFSENVK